MRCHIKTIFQCLSEDFHCKNKTMFKSSYLYNGNPFTGMMASLYQNRAQGRFMRLLTILYPEYLCGNIDYIDIFFHYQSLRLCRCLKTLLLDNKDPLINKNHQKITQHFLIIFDMACKITDFLHGETQANFKLKSKICCHKSLLIRI